MRKEMGTSVVGFPRWDDMVPKKVTEKISKTSTEFRGWDDTAEKVTEDQLEDGSRR